MKRRFLNKTYLMLGGMVGMVMLAGGILTLSGAHADDSSVSTATVTVPVACSMSGTGMNTHNAEINNGTYTADIGTTTLHAFCNDNEGFSIYAVGYTDNEFGKNVLTNSTIGNTYDIVTGTANSGSTSNWAMKLAITQDSGDTTGTNAFLLDNSFGSYHNVPAEYTKAAHKNSATDMTESTGGVKLTTTYAAFISQTQPAGAYTGQVKYTLVHPASDIPAQPHVATSGCINYFANASTAVGTMGCQAIGGSDTSARLFASNYSRSGYGFAGWSDVYDYDTNPNAHFYGPQETITFDAGQYTDENNGLSMYAVWVKSAGSMQDMSELSTVCGTGVGSLTTAPSDGTANLDSVTAFTDQRDGQTYAIAKLADGKCWMIENLRLEADGTRGAANEALAQGYASSNYYGNFIGLADAEYSGFTSSNVANNSIYYTGAQSGTAIIDIGSNNRPEIRMPRYNNTNTISRASNPSTDRFGINSYGGMYSYGNYYTWSAAIANTRHYDSPNYRDEEDKTPLTVATSICPFGWRLPRAFDSTSGTSSNDFWWLVVDGLGNSSLGTRTSASGNEAIAISKSLTAFPTDFLFSGHFSDAEGRGRGSDSFYWSGIPGNATAVGFSMFESSNYKMNLYLGYSSLIKFSGYSIRCIFNN